MKMDRTDLLETDLLETDLLEDSIHERFEEPLVHSGYQKLMSVEQETEENQAIVDEAMTELATGLYKHRIDSGDQDWGAFQRMVLLHPVKEVLYEDPFTRHAAEKPRGYAGDAELMDYIYRREAPWRDEEASPPLALQRATPRGRMIYNYSSNSPASQASRARCREVARLLDEMAAKVHRPDVISIASGHLRESAASEAVREGRLRRFIALDSDPFTLRTMRDQYGKYGVQGVPASIRQLLTQDLGLGFYDFVYSTGLFDYLQQSTAKRLTSKMFQLLKPGGRLMVANVMPGIPDVGYMESFMGWNLIQRTRKEMMDITMDIPQEQIADIRVYAEAQNNIILLQIVRT